MSGDTRIPRPDRYRGLVQVRDEKPPRLEMEGELRVVCVAVAEMLKEHYGLYGLAEVRIERL